MQPGSENVTQSSPGSETTIESSKTAVRPDSISQSTTQLDPGDHSKPKIDDPDKFLIGLEKILQRIHSLFYSEYDAMQQSTHTREEAGGGVPPHSDDIPTPDLKQIIPRLRKSVLEGANLVFTEVIRTSMPIERSREWKHSLSV